MRNARLALAVALSIGAAGPSWAGSPYRAAPPDRSRPDPAGADAPDPARLRGCVPLCAFDASPCDPPTFKQADGRCNRA
jgi:hypothetical protein